VTSMLHLDASANHCANHCANHSADGLTGESVSRQLSGLHADAWRARHGSDGYRYRDLAAEPVPPLTAAYCALGRRVERYGLVALDKVAAFVESAAEEREWALTRPLIEEVRAAGTLLVGTPMYNLSVPAGLKAWIDRVTFPGAFVDPDAGDSLLSATRVVIVAARGGSYGPGSPGEGMDFQVPYLRAYFRKQGVAESRIHAVAAELTVAGMISAMAGLRSTAEESLRQARNDVLALAAVE
jgi:FMN-dependent NADH-azoreductase